MKRKISKKNLIKGDFINNRKTARNLAKANMKKAGLKNITRTISIKKKDDSEVTKSFFSHNWRKFSYGV